MLQLVYISTARGTVPAAELHRILLASRRNNGRDDVTGLLFFDGRRFLQALEGPTDRVVATFDRIGADPRHAAIVILSRREIAEREFGRWAMASHGAGQGEEAILARVAALTENAAPTVRATFNSFAAFRRAA